MALKKPTGLWATLTAAQREKALAYDGPDSIGPDNEPCVQPKTAKKPTVMEIRDGRTFGWLGVDCTRCKGTGQVYDPARDNESACTGCGGTGEAYGEIPAVRA